MRINAERVKEAPAEALRAAFARIGQLVLAADKMRRRGADPDSPAPGFEPAVEGATPSSRPGSPAGAASGPRGAAESTATPVTPPVVSVKRSLDLTGNVRLLTAEDLPEARGPEPEAARYEPEPTAIAEPQEIVEPQEIAQPTADLSEAGLPEAAAPEAAAAETGVPDDIDTETTAPQPPVPAAAAPEAAIPAAAAPEAAIPAAVIAEAAIPETAAPQMAPAAAAPDDIYLEATAPETAAPQTTAPATAALDEIDTETTAPQAPVPAAAVGGAGEAADDEAARFETGLSEVDLPVPSYDSLSVPSLRARLRSLDAAQVGMLAEYERSHAGRADVVAMFERRIAKLAASG
jgi:hypothetical protein